MSLFLPKSCLRATAARFGQGRDGSVALEFSLVALPLLAIIGAIFQTAFTIWAGQSLDHTLQSTARLLLTGEFQAGNSDTKDAATLLARLKTRMCGSGSNKTVTVFDCPGVRLDVSLGSSFASSAPPSPVSSSGDWSSGFGSNYTCAAPGSVVVVTAAVKSPVFFKLLSLGTASFADGSHLLQSTAVFRTEPYQTGSGQGC